MLNCLILRCNWSEFEPLSFTWEYRPTVRLTLIFSSFLSLSFGAAWAAVQGRGEDEWAGWLLLWENLQRQGGCLQGGRRLDRWLQELHVHGEASHCVRAICVCTLGARVCRLIRYKGGHSILIKCVSKSAHTESGIMCLSYCMCLGGCRFTTKPVCHRINMCIYSMFVS